MPCKGKHAEPTKPPPKSKKNTVPKLDAQALADALSEALELDKNQRWWQQWRKYTIDEIGDGSGVADREEHGDGSTAIALQHGDGKCWPADDLELELEQALVDAGELASGTAEDFVEEIAAGTEADSEADTIAAQICEVLGSDDDIDADIDEDLMHALKASLLDVKQEQGGATEDSEALKERSTGSDGAPQYEEPTLAKLSALDLAAALQAEAVADGQHLAAASPVAQAAANSAAALQAEAVADGQHLAAASPVAQGAPDSAAALEAEPLVGKNVANAIALGARLPTKAAATAVGADPEALEAEADGKKENDVALDSEHYYVSPELKLAMQNAKAPKEIDIKDRNKLYCALSRQTLPGPVAARWAEDSQHRDRKFQFLKDWVADTSCGYLMAIEEHTVTDADYNGTEYQWIMKMDLLVKYNGLVAGSPGAKFVETLLKGTESKPHPQHPDDENMTMHRLLHKMVDGHRHTNKRCSGYKLQADVDKKEVGECLLAVAEKNQKLVDGRASSTREDGPKTKRRRTQKEPKLPNVNTANANGLPVSERKTTAQKSPTILIHAKIGEVRKAIYSLKHDKDDTFRNRYKGLIEELEIKHEALKTQEATWETQEMRGEKQDHSNNNS